MFGYQTIGRLEYIKGLNTLYIPYGYVIILHAFSCMYPTMDVTMDVTLSSNTIYDIRSVSTIFVGMFAFFYDIRSVFTMFVMMDVTMDGWMVISIMLFSSGNKNAYRYFHWKCRVITGRL